MSMPGVWMLYAYCGQMPVRSVASIWGKYRMWQKILNYDVIKHVERPYSKTGGIAVLRGNLAVDGAVVKREPKDSKHKVKLKRAQGECLGTGSRRRTR